MPLTPPSPAGGEREHTEFALAETETEEFEMTDKMLSRKDGGIGYLIFNNPERHNAVSMEMWAATGDILEQFRNDPDVRVVVLTGAGGKAFVSGADISKFGAERSSEEAVAKYNATTERAF
jgi:enoyl-CoA hydratase/carnithine racemase